MEEIEWPGDLRTAILSALLHGTIAIEGGSPPVGVASLSVRIGPAQAGPRAQAGPDVSGPCHLLSLLRHMTSVLSEFAETSMKRWQQVLQGRMSLHVL